MLKKEQREAIYRLALQQQHADLADYLDSITVPEGWRAVPAEPPPEFVAWVRYNIPAGTVISDPGWWIPRLWRAVRNSTTDRQEDAA